MASTFNGALDPHVLILAPHSGRDNVESVETFFPPRDHQRDQSDASAQTPLATYIPQNCNGSILVTPGSKDAVVELVGSYNRIKVAAMDEHEGLQLLRNKLRDPPTKESAIELLDALDYIPLAILQAIAYINRDARMTVVRYLDEFRRSSKKRENLLNWAKGKLLRNESVLNSVVTTWQISFEQVWQERQTAAELLSLMSFFNPQGIPVSTLRRYSKDVVVATNVEDEEESDIRFDEDLNTLQEYSLVSMTADNDTCDMDYLVQFCTRVWLLSSGGAEQGNQKFIALMAQELPNGEYKNWEKCQQLFPHIEPLFDTEPVAEEALKAWAQVLTNAAWYLWNRGIYDTAEKIAVRALHSREKVLGLNSDQTLESVKMLASVLWSQGRFDDAETLNRRALEGCEKGLGERHPKTMAIMDNLTRVLQTQGKYEEAETLHRRALEVNEKELGENHPVILTNMNNLAEILQAQGKYEEAETLNRRALEGYKKGLGEDHPDTLTSIDDLARVLQAQGKYEEAETLNRRALERCEKRLGEHHPNTVAILNTLAKVLHAQTKYADAETLLRRALEVYEKVLGEDHPATLTNMNNLTGVLRAQGKYEEAETLNRRALEGCEKGLGEDHPDTLTSMDSLAKVLQAQGKYEEAETFNRRALQGRNKELERRHPDTPR